MFKALFIIIGIIAGWFSCIAAIALISFIQLDRHVPGQVTAWRVVEYSPSQVALEAFYTFSIEGKLWERQMIFSKPYYLNLPSAEKALKEKKQESWDVWYNHRDPKKSSLEKIFPYKKCFNALVVIALLGYFWILKQRNSEPT